MTSRLLSRLSGALGACTPIALAVLSVLSILSALSACSDAPPGLAVKGDRQVGRDLIQQAGCGSCHRIPGVASAQGRVGPPLTQLARRGYLAGVVPNNPEQLVRWLSDPKSVSPLTAMPDTGVTTDQARNVAAYLYQPD